MKRNTIKKNLKNKMLLEFLLILDYLNLSIYQAFIPDINVVVRKSEKIKDKKKQFRINMDF